MFSRPPTQEKLTDHQGKFSTSWERHFSSQYAYINTNLSPSGFVHPNLTTAQSTAQSGTAKGTTIFNTTLNKLQVYNGTTWETITSA